jgi:hypothetical protein
MSIGCGGLALLGVIGIGSCALLTRDVRDKELVPVAEAYFAKANEGDFHGAYAGFGAPMRATTSEANYVSFDKGVHERLGKLQSKTVANTQAGFGTQGAWGVMDYRGHFERGDATIRFRFQKDAGVWKIAGLRYDSPVFTDAIRSTEK